MAWNRRAALRSTETEPSQEPVRDDLWALCYLHDWDPPIDGQEHRWEPGKNVFPAVHAFYRRWEDAEAIRKDMSNPEKYWVVRTKAECELRLSKAARVSPASPRPDREAEENERLRALIRQFSDVADFMDLETEGFDMSDKLALVYKNEDDEEVAHITNFDLRVFYECRAALAKEGK